MHTDTVIPINYKSNKVNCLMNFVRTYFFVYHSIVVVCVLAICMGLIVVVEGVFFCEFLFRLFYCRFSFSSLTIVIYVCIVWILQFLRNFVFLWLLNLFGVCVKLHSISKKSSNHIDWLKCALNLISNWMNSRKRVSIGFFNSVLIS